MPDRELTLEELVAFRQESRSQIAFSALKIMDEEQSKPTLHDLCIIELMARSQAQTNAIIDLGRQIELLKLKLKE